MPSSVVSILVSSLLGICGGVRIPTVAELDDSSDRPRSVFAEQLTYDVALGEVTLNSLQCKLLQLRNIILAGRSARVYE